MQHREKLMNAIKFLFAILFVSYVPFFAQPTFISEPLGSFPKNAHGILHLSLFSNQGLTKPDVRSIPVRKEPDPTSQLVMMLRLQQDVLKCEVEYERNAALVFGQTPGWFQIQTKYGKGWVSQNHVGDFISIESLLSNSMTYLETSEWDGFLYSLPNFSSEIVIYHALFEGKPSLARFLEWKWSNGQPWIKVTLLSNDICSGENLLESEVSGWIPAYTRKGNLIMWIYPRGC
jgi:hypothetical protein